MAYTADESLFESQIAAAARAAGTAGVWAGIGAYRLTPDQTVARIAGARRAGAEGVVLFSYDAMIEADRPPTYLVDVARGAFGGQRAAAGSR
jgi:predicted Zn-dependent protease